MAINPLYIPLFTIEEVILDKDTGLPLAAGVVSFYRDSQRLTPKVVYQIAGVSPNYTFVSVGSQLTLGLSGTFVDQNGDPFVPYAYPYDDLGELDLYYVTVVSAGGVPQFVRQAVPHVDTNSIPPSERTSTENEISNPQFVEVNFREDTIATIDVTGSATVTPIAPGWDVITTGTGTLTLERLQPTSAGVVTNPPYALRINASAGLGSTIQLRQRFLNTPSIFRNGFISASFTAAVLSGGGTFVSMSYAPSTGTSTQIIASTSIPTDAAYHTIAGNVAIPDQANDPADTGYTDILITLPTTRNIAITSIQVVGAAISIDIPFDEQTAERQRDHLAHYYKPQLAYKQIPSYLVGWDFPLNPAQIAGKVIASQSTGANSSYYTWDQTILFQSVNNSIAVSDSPDGAIALIPNTTTQLALIQYLDFKQVRKLLSQNLCVNLASVITGSPVPLTISLWCTTDASLPLIGTNKSLVATLDANGKPATFNGTWTEIPRDIIQDANPTITSGSDYVDYPFNGWFLNNNTLVQTSTYFAIVIGTASIASGTTLYFQSIGLMAGNIPTRPAPQSYDEVLRQCQYYFEKSYPINVLAGSVTLSGAKVSTFLTSVDTSGLVYNMYSQTFGFNYQQTKRVSPIVTFFSPSGDSNKIRVGMLLGNVYPSPDSALNTNPRNEAISDYSAVSNTRESIFMVPTTSPGLQLYSFNSSGSSAGIAAFTLQGLITFHYVADARLGIV